MNQIYGIEPDLCIQNPALILDFGKDIILPKYFYSQLHHLRGGNYYEATEAADLILQSLYPMEELENILVFKTDKNGIIYFIDQEISLDSSKFTDDQFDTQNPFDRYLLSLYKLSNLLTCQTLFIINSSAIIQKCRLLNFRLINIQDFSNYRESWLNTEHILSLHSQLLSIASQVEPILQIQWNDEAETITEVTDNIIYWQDL